MDTDQEPNLATLVRRVYEIVERLPLDQAKTVLWTVGALLGMKSGSGPLAKKDAIG